MQSLTARRFALSPRISIPGEITPLIQEAQAKELLASAGATALPVIYAGDFNSSADDPSDPTFPTYKSLINSGLTDAWTVANPGDPGFTCCQSPICSTPTLASRRESIWRCSRGHSASTTHISSAYRRRTRPRTGFGRPTSGAGGDLRRAGRGTCHHRRVRPGPRRARCLPSLPSAGNSPRSQLQPRKGSRNCP